MTHSEWATKCRREADRALAEGDTTTARIVLDTLSYHERYCREDHST